jgi:hypothetical protein
MLDDLRRLVGDLVRDDAERVATGQSDRAISLAVVQYDKDRPRRCVEDVVAPGGGSLALPDGARRVVQVEAPAGIIPPCVLPSRAWGHYNAPDGVKLLFPAPLAEGTPVRLTLTRAHDLTASVDTIPEADREAVASYAAAVLFEQIAATTSGVSSPTIPADTVDHGSKPVNFAKRAELLRQRYYDLLGIDVKRQQPASAVATQPLPASDGGHRLTHFRRRWRR